jgi:hypothetical protein
MIIIFIEMSKDKMAICKAGKRKRACHHRRRWVLGGDVQGYSTAEQECINGGIHETWKLRGYL